jgi:ferredoxin-nitrite reductase
VISARSAAGGAALDPGLVRQLLIYEALDEDRFRGTGHSPTDHRRMRSRMLMWVRVAALADMIPDRACVVRAGGLDLALVCSREGFFAMDNACPHSGGALGEGQVQGGTLTCPLHGWQFECKTGRSLTEKRPSQKIYPVKVDGDDVLVEVPEPDRTTAEGAPGAAAPVAAEAATKRSPVELWKQAKHGIDVWPDLLRWAQDGTSMSQIPEADLERLKWYGYFQRKNHDFDHYMCRIRIPGCEMSAGQARTLALIAHQSGYGLVDVTTRGNLQIQGLPITALPTVRAALEKVGLTARQSGHDNVRNVTSHPWSGIDPDELFDTRDLARQIQAMVIGNRELSDLPRKMNVALTGRPAPPAHAWTQDITYAAALGLDGSVGFHLLLGGTQGQAPKLAWHVPVFVRPAQVLDVTAAVLRTFRELGHRHNRHQVRMRYLIERIGADGMLTETEKRLGCELERFPLKPVAPIAEESFTGWFKQKQEGLWAVGIGVPVGRLTADELDGVAAIAQRFGDGGLRTTYDQNLVVTGIPSPLRAEVEYEIARHGLTFEPDSVSRHTVACTGKQFCNIAVTETKGYAYRLIEELRRRRVQLHGVRIAMSGCPSSCAMTYTADIGLKGVKIRRGLRVLDAFDLYVGGGVGPEIHMGTLFQKGVPFDQLPDVVEKLVREFFLRRAAGQTFSAYWRQKLQGHKAEPLTVDVPRWRCSGCAHVHAAPDPPPFCPMCAAVRAKFEPMADDEPELTAPAAGISADEKAPAVAAPPVVVPAKPSGRRILIVGGSIGGHTAAAEVRRHDPEARITLVTDEKLSFYNRLNLTLFLAGQVTRRELFDYAPRWYEEQQIELLTESRVIGIDAAHKTALLEEGREIAYDACILAHGGSAALPPFHRGDLAGVHTLRTLADVEAVIADICPGTKVAVIGGGVLGLEAAYGAHKREGVVQVFEHLSHLMPRQLDRTAADVLAQAVSRKGIRVHVGVGVQELIGRRKRVEGLVLSNGRSFEAQVVIVSAGLQPNVEWVKRSGIQCQRGIVVNDRMQTSLPDVYAAGDVAEWRGHVVGLWPNAVEQAKVAAASATGKMAIFQGFVPITTLKCLGIPVASIGEIREDGGAITSRVTADAGAGTYRRVILRNGIPIGAILVGTATGMGELRQLVEDGLELEKLKDRLVPEARMAVS